MMNKIFLISWNSLCLFLKFTVEITDINIYKQSGKTYTISVYENDDERNQRRPK